MPRAKRDYEAQVQCWAHGCHTRPESGALPVRLMPDLTVSVVLCPNHEESLRDHTGQSLREQMPAPVYEEGEGGAHRRHRSPRRAA